jgi:hypothetical protein
MNSKPLEPKPSSSREPKPKGSPELMVKCPSCGANKGFSCGITTILPPHVARVEAYKAWKESLCDPNRTRSAS